jgi:hypothetical protein
MELIMILNRCHEWCRQTMRSRIEPTMKIARSLRKHRELILNYFRAQKMLSRRT